MQLLELYDSADDNLFKNTNNEDSDTDSNDSANEVTEGNNEIDNDVSGTLIQYDIDIDVSADGKTDTIKSDQFSSSKFYSQNDDIILNQDNPLST